MNVTHDAPALDIQTHCTSERLKWKEEEEEEEEEERGRSFDSPSLSSLSLPSLILSLLLAARLSSFERISESIGLITGMVNGIEGGD